MADIIINQVIQIIGGDFFSFLGLYCWAFCFCDAYGPVEPVDRERPLAAGTSSIPCLEGRGKQKQKQKNISKNLPSLWQSRSK